MDSLVNIYASRTNIATNTDNGHIWAGGVVSLPSLNDYRSRVILVTVKPDVISALIADCRQLGITLTNLLHGIICATLSHLVNDAPGFRAITPYSARRFTKAHLDDIVNHVSFARKFVSLSTIQRLKSCKPHSQEEFHHILELAREFSREMDAALAQFPYGNGWAELGHVQDLEAHCRDQAGQDRACTYELSNLGNLGNQSQPKSLSKHGPFALESLAFTQCGTVAGQAIGFN
jgi:hypothetical protein